MHIRRVKRNNRHRVYYYYYPGKVVGIIVVRRIDCIILVVKRSPINFLVGIIMRDKLTADNNY